MVCVYSSLELGMLFCKTPTPFFGGGGRYPLGLLQCYLACFSRTYRGFLLVPLKPY